MNILVNELNWWLGQTRSLVSDQNYLLWRIISYM